MKKLIALTILAGLILIHQVFVFADAVDKIQWCHCEPNGNCEELNLPQQALEQAGHVNAQGNILHAEDHPGVCVEPTSTVTPTIEPTQGITPTEAPTPTVVAPTNVQPTGVQPTGVQPTGEPKAGEPLPQGAYQPALHGQGEPETGGIK